MSKDAEMKMRAEDPRVVRVSARFFRLVLEEELSPEEVLRAWLRIVGVMIRERWVSHARFRAVLLAAIEAPWPVGIEVGESGPESEQAL